jgi:ribose 5-phosphate isomerase A
MVVWLGGGNTAILTIWRSGQLLREGRLHDIMDIPCSSVIEAKASGLGIPIALDPPGAVDLRRFYSP